MNILLIFFALPIATIIISIALQKILKCPPLVSAVIFAIFLIVTFVINNINFLVAAIVYAIIAFITAAIVCIICRLIERFRDNDDDCGCERSNCGCRRNRRCACQRNTDNSNDLLRISSCCGNSNNGDLITISSNGCNGVNNDLLTISSNCPNRTNNDCDCNNENSNCGCARNTRNGVTARINVIPNTNGNGCGQISGCYRRRN